MTIYSDADYAGFKMDRKRLVKLVNLQKIALFCDNTSTIHMTKNANQHSKTKHIDIRYHFLRDHYEKGDIEIDYVSADF